MERSTAEVLTAAREMIATPEAWTRRSYARNAAGYTIGVDTPRAVCFCSLGALAAGAFTLLPKAYRDIGSVERGELAQALARGLPAEAEFEPDTRARDRIEDFNDADATTHADVLAMFDRAIALAAQGDF